MEVLTKDGNLYPTIVDAASDFGVSAKTVRQWIERGLLDPPPQLDYGLRSVAYFPESYMRKARSDLQRHREQRRNTRGG